MTARKTSRVTPAALAASKPGNSTPTNESSNSADIDLDKLVTEFDSGYGRARLKNQCRVCDSGLPKLVDALLMRGAGVGSISAFLRDKKLGDNISESAIDRHKKLHFNARNR